MCEITPPSHHFTYLAMDDPSALMAEHSCSKNWLHAGQGYLDPPFLPFLIAIESFLPSRHIKAKEGACTEQTDQRGHKGPKGGSYILAVSESKPFHLKRLCFFGCDTFGPKHIWSLDIWSPTIGPQLIGPSGQTVPNQFCPHGQMVPKNLVPLDKWSPTNLVPLDKWSPKI